MTEAKHTPGPWEVGTSPVRETLFVGSADAWICGELDNPNTPLETGEALANARLIAAAPDMLAALQGLTRFCEAVRAQVGMGKTQQARLDAARAAIAKATGAA